MAIQFLPLPAISFPQNAMINFAPMNQALQFSAQNALDRARFGLQENQDIRAQEMHPLQMAYQQAQTAGLTGQEARAQERQPYDLRQLTAQTGLLGAQTAASRGQEARAAELHVPALQLSQTNAANATDQRQQQMDALLAMAPDEATHGQVLQILRARGYNPTGANATWANRGATAVAAGPALTQAQIAAENLRRLNPLNDVTDRQAMAARLGWDPARPPTPFQMYGLTGQIAPPQPLPAQAMTMIGESDNAVQSGLSAIQSLNQALQLSRRAFAGPGAGTLGAVTALTGPGAGQATVEFDQIMRSQALEQLKAIFGAAPTEGERKILLEVQGSASQPQNVRDNIIRRAIQAAQDRIRQHTERAAALRSGTYFTPQAPPAPVPGAGGGAAAAPPAQNGTAGAAPAVQTVTTAEQRMALPVGAQFNWHGAVYVKIGPNQYQMVR